MQDMPLLVVIFKMGGGHVLDFKDASFASFFAEVIG